MPAKNDRPNLLLICTDQQRFDTIHAAGNPHIRTPHLDWLAESGVHFTRCYSDSPICVAARATMITGRHYYNLRPTGHGWWGEPTAPDPAVTLPGLLTRAGYQTRAIGKAHFKPARCHYGFEHMELLHDYYRYMAKHPQLGVPMDHGLGQNEMEPGISTVDETHSLTRWTVERSIDFLETRDESRPFFLYTSFSKPHPPFDPCASYWQLYANAEMPPPVRGDWSRTAEIVPGGFLQPTWHLNGADRFSEGMLRDVRRAYYALITQIDYNLGVLFARLREMGLLENTLIVFTSDHGEMLGDHYMGAKTVFFEGSAHVPMIVHSPPGMLPDELAGGPCDALVCLADIMPTFLGAAGVKPAENVAMDGIDLLAVARGEAKRGIFFGECEYQHCVIEGSFKYVFTSLGGAELMFDLAKDPLEQRNLIAAGTHNQKRRELRTKLVEHLSRGGHPAAEGGELRALQPAPTRRDRALRRWPGFHTRAERSDVLH